MITTSVCPIIVVQHKISHFDVPRTVDDLDTLSHLEHTQILVVIENHNTVGDAQDTVCYIRSSL